ncbi:GNAT family N-acetyltransferase [Clostridium sp. D33t1_170424_F3]|uniref:GNAT family N-acetyltransferase n=1 Tax=Clostridium sp. D33t1_170424_F3 TaxID=2787099 RepID=UPI0018A9B9A5|nr:GNAT family N-acetyltransferase [Clostridium sp. D33t1_170424_F3]
MISRKINKSDMNACVAFVEVVKDDFAGYKEEEFQKAVQDGIADGTALLAEENGIIGLLLFSREKKELEFLAVHPRARRRGVAKRLIEMMAANFQSGDVISVVTFREGDPKGIAARACYHACGFQDDELLEVFHYPCQKMVYSIS